ncbi:MAG: hypothetical protein JRH20_06015 [Deltaproteobacteria bacterium]|nr:hypothetical protein [Deltaproteobacteria bacterium]
MASTSPFVYDVLMLRKSFALADVVLLVLGANLLSTFLLVPMLHYRGDELDGPLLASLLPISLLVAGVLTANRGILLFLVPVSLLLPLSLLPQLAGAKALSPTGFLLLAVALLGFTFGSAWVASTSRGAPLPSKRRQLEASPSVSRKHRRRLRIYTLFLLTCVAFPLTLIYALYLRPDAAALVEARFPERGPAASLLFGVLVTVFWLSVFLRYVAAPLRDHIRGDQNQRQQLKALEGRLHQRKAPASLYLYLLLALVMLALFWLHLRGSPPP